MVQKAKQLVLITGASGGIGLEFAHLFAQDGYDLVLVARNEGKLQKIASELSQKYGIHAHVITSDLSDVSAPQALFARLENEGLAVDVLVNNAGFASYGLFAEADLTKELEMMQVNMVTLTHLSRLFLPGMLARRRGGILNVASTAAFQPGPLMAVYYATKAYVLSLTEALANELRGTGVVATALCPGPTASGFQERAAMQDSKLVQQGLMDATTVAKIGYKAFLKGKVVVIPGLKNKILALTPRFLPRKMVTATVRSVQEKKS